MCVLGGGVWSPCLPSGSAHVFKLVVKKIITVVRSQTDLSGPMDV